MLSSPTVDGPPACSAPSPWQARASPSSHPVSYLASPASAGEVREPRVEHVGINDRVTLFESGEIHADPIEELTAVEALFVGRRWERQLPRDVGAGQCKHIGSWGEVACCWDV